MNYFEMRKIIFFEEVFSVVTKCSGRKATTALRTQVKHSAQ